MVAGLFAARLPVDIAEDQFTLASAVRGAHDVGDFLVVHQFFDDGELGFRLGQYLCGDRFRQDGQVLHPPFLVSLVDLVRLLQADQMAQRPGDDVSVAGDAAVAGSFCAQHAGDIAGDGGFLRYDQCGHRLCLPSHVYNERSIPHFPAAAKEKFGKTMNCDGKKDNFVTESQVR